MKKIPRVSRKNGAVSQLLGAALCLLFPLSCATSVEAPQYRRSATHTGTAGPQLKSPQAINLAPTYQLYFTLSHPEKCVKIRMSARRTAQDVYVVRPVFTYFIAERSVDLRKFGKTREPFVFTEIGRNFDENWSRRTEIEICSGASDPLKKLEPGVYRIRFSVLENAGFNYTAVVSSNEGDAAYSEKFPEAP